MAAEALPRLGAAAVTVSGVSSGGYMAVQMHVAHSSRVAGAGVIAGGPYYCAQGSLLAARNNCMAPGWFTPLPSMQHLKALTDQLARTGQIDATSHLAKSRVWLFSGTNDRTVLPSVVQALSQWYALYGVQPAVVADRPAGHGMVTEAAGGACGETGPPYLNDCDYDAAGALLAHLLGRLQAAAPATAAIRQFGQDEFAQGEARAIGLAASGYAYVPEACKAGGCRVHVAFHGCRQNAEAVGDRFVREAGYNRWAESNRLVVLYPQTKARYYPLYNPRACWDWWGYTGAQYATRSGPQVRAVMRMVERLAEKP